MNGYALNHTALSVHQIAGHQGDIYSFANELVVKGFSMNDAGGIMKVCFGCHMVCGRGEGREVGVVSQWRRVCLLPWLLSRRSFGGIAVHMLL